MKILPPQARITCRHRQVRFDPLRDFCFTRAAIKKGGGMNTVNRFARALAGAGLLACALSFAAALSAASPGPARAVRC